MAERHEMAKTQRQQPRPPTEAEHDEAVVDEASEESFPASDPPAFTGTIAGDGSRRPARAK